MTTNFIQTDAFVFINSQLCEFFSRYTFRYNYISYATLFLDRYRPKHSGRKSNPGLMERGWNRSKGMDPHAKFLCRSQRMVMMALEKSKTHKGKNMSLVYQCNLL